MSLAHVNIRLYYLLKCTTLHTRKNGVLGLAFGGIDVCFWSIIDDRSGLFSTRLDVQASLLFRIFAVQCPVLAQEEIKIFLVYKMILVSSKLIQNAQKMRA